MATIPTISRAIDTAFTTTWFEMQKKATDNILDGNVISAILREKGCFKKQTGGSGIERTVRYGKKTAIAVMKGDTLPTGEDELETAAFWNWKYLTVHIQRSLQDDQQNSGPAKIKDLVQLKIEAARDALDEKFENCLIAPVTTVALGGTGQRLTRDQYSIFNFLPGDTTRGAVGNYFNQTPVAGTSPTYGGIDTGTGNPWWQAKYATAVNPALMNMKDQIRNLFNTCAGGTKNIPDLMLMDQTRYEAFEDLMESEIQRVDNTGSRTASLGYDVLKYKGADAVWTGNSNWPSGGVALLNTSWIDVVYDPGLWFTMLPWMYLPNQLERITRIVCAFPGVICYQLRRQGYLGAYTS